MGAWDTGAFDNDAAADWSWLFDDVDASAGLAVLRAALAAATTGWVDAHEGAVAVAAATVVSWLVDPASIGESPYDGSVVRWVETHRPTPPDQLVRGARHVLERLQSVEHSELAELWAETDDDSWARRVNVTLARLEDRR